MVTVKENFLSFTFSSTLPFVQHARGAQGLFSPSAFHRHSPVSWRRAEPDGDAGRLLALSRGTRLHVGHSKRQEAFSGVGQDHCVLPLHLPRAVNPTLQLRPGLRCSPRRRSRTDAERRGRRRGGRGSPLHGWQLPGRDRGAVSPSAQAHSFAHGLRVIATPTREQDPLIFFIKMQINLIKSGIVN